MFVNISMGSWSVDVFPLPNDHANIILLIDSPFFGSLAFVNCPTVGLQLSNNTFVKSDSGCGYITIALLAVSLQPCCDVDINCRSYKMESFVTFIGKVTSGDAILFIKITPADGFILHK